MKKISKRWWTHRRNKVAGTEARLELHRDAEGKMARESHRQAKRRKKEEKPKEREKKSQTPIARRGMKDRCGHSEGGLPYLAGWLGAILHRY